MALICLMLLHGCGGTAAADVYAPPAPQKELSGKRVYLNEKAWGHDWHGIINWERGYIQATAQGISDPAKVGGQAQAELLAIKAGRYISYARLLELVRLVRVDTYGDIASLAKRQPNLDLRVRGVIRNAQAIYERAFMRSDGWMVGEVTTRLYFKDLRQVGLRSYASIARPPVVLYQPAPEPEIKALPKKEPAPIGVKKYQPEPGGATVDKVSAPGPEAFQEEPKPELPPFYTGLIVDASGLEGKPALFPSVVEDGTGRQLFGLGVIDVNQAAKEGVVGYAPSLDAARKNPRVGANPLVVSAIQASGLNRAKFAVSPEDAKTISDADAKAAFLAKCKVVIVIN